MFLDLRDETGAQLLATAVHWQLALATIQVYAGIVSRWIACSDLTAIPSSTASKLRSRRSVIRYDLTEGGVALGGGVISTRRRPTARTGIQSVCEAQGRPGDHSRHHHPSPFGHQALDLARDAARAHGAVRELIVANWVGGRIQ